MKKIISSLFIPLLLTLNTFYCTAQESKKDAVAKAITDYFFMERENIYVQCNKNVFITNEKIWFKGYVFHRKKSLPFFTTVNVFANLLDESGNILETQLVYANIGSFTGSFELNEKYKSGRYYLRFYTNWMNNFIEDESFISEITVVNPATGAGNLLAGPDPSKINIELHPEGGTLLSGVTNIIGVSISDCNHDPLKVTEVDITDASGKSIQKVQVNKLGHGRFILPANAPQGYTAVVTIDGVKHSQPLPAQQQKGIALEVNNFSVPDKTIITLSTNKLSLDFYAGKQLYLVIHKDEDANIYDLNFNGSLTTKITVPNSDLPEGLNTVRILDTDLNQLAERLIYKYPASTLSTQLGNPAATSDALQYQGKVNYPNMNLSVAILPEGTRSLTESNDIYSSLLLLPYIENYKKAWGRHYFTTLSKGKMYELDLFLLSQKSRYQWLNIFKNPPKNSYSFDMGLSLKGTVPAQAGDTRYAKVRLFSLSPAIDETVDVNDKREFVFDNLLLPDSTYVNFTLLRKDQKPKELTLSPQVLNGNKKFNKQFTPIPSCHGAVPIAAETAAAPKTFKESTELEEIKIDGKRLKYANVHGNSFLRAYKITDAIASGYFSLVNYLKAYSGFNVDDRDGVLTILSRQKTSINAGQSGPIVYVDGVQQMDFTMLTLIRLDEVDEIYMNPNAIVPSVRNYQGIIKIYLKKGVQVGVKNKTPDIIIKNGYEKIIPFQNLNYTNTVDEGFINFGVIGWNPMIMTDENGAFQLEIPKTGQKSMKIIIEGFSADGKLISETKIITAQ